MVINIRIPEKGKNTLKFQNYHKQMPGPFEIYVDFEAITEKTNTKGVNLIIPNHIPNHTKNILAAAMVTKLFAAMIIHILSLYRFIEPRSRLKSLCKRC